MPFRHDVRVLIRINRGVVEVAIDDELAVLVADQLPGGVTRELRELRARLLGIGLGQVTIAGVDRDDVVAEIEDAGEVSGIGGKVRAIGGEFDPARRGNSDGGELCGHVVLPGLRGEAMGGLSAF